MAKLAVPAESVVYVIGNADNRLVKIGTTTADKLDRLGQIQTMSPSILTVLWTTPGNRDLEHKLHYRFRAERRHGEWFDFGDLDPVAKIAEAVKELRAEPMPELQPQPVPAPWAHDGYVGGDLFEAVRKFIGTFRRAPQGAVQDQAPDQLVSCFELLADMAMCYARGMPDRSARPGVEAELWKQASDGLALVRDIMWNLAALNSGAHLPRTSWATVLLNAYPDDASRPAEVTEVVERWLPVASPGDISRIKTGAEHVYEPEDPESPTLPLDVPLARLGSFIGGWAQCD